MVLLTLLLLTLLLALAVGGVVHTRRDEGRVTITIESGDAWAWTQAAWEACGEFLATVLRRRNEPVQEIRHHRFRPELGEKPHP